MAVTLVEPTVGVDVVNFAFPPLNWAVPNTVFPAVNVTGPVAVTVERGDLGGEGYRLFQGGGIWRGSERCRAGGLRYYLVQGDRGAAQVICVACFFKMS